MDDPKKGKKKAAIGADRIVGLITATIELATAVIGLILTVHK